MGQIESALSLIRPRRRIRGMSAVLLPFTSDGRVDWPGFEAHVRRTADAGLTPAVNMDTGYGNLIDDGARREALDRTKGVLGGGWFVAGAFVPDSPGDPFNPDAYLRRAEEIESRGGSPVIFQSYGLTRPPGPRIVEAYRRIAQGVNRFFAFELGTMFAPFGAIYDLETYRGLLGIERCVGAKHSSLRRELEWDRLRLRDAERPDFLVLTGNDLAIDMVMYGSDYLLGLSTFAPDLFARRDACWESGDDRFYEMNDALQYLGFFAFRSPTPAYKHSAAQFLKIRGWIESDRTHPDSPPRPESDREILCELWDRLREWGGGA